MVITATQIREDLYQAYFDARANKRNTLAQLSFEIVLEREIEKIYYSLLTRTFRPLPAYSFISFVPVQREVYASSFRDRVVQHMLYNYLAPLFETLYIYDTYSCRKGKGTLFGVERYQHHLRSVTNNFTQEAWLLYIDLSGYFMSIDKMLVIDTIMDTVISHYDRRSPDGRKWRERIDPDFVSYLLHCFLDRNPSKDAIILGDPHNWDGLPKRKSLRYSPEGYGIVIGDIGSQLFSNVLLNIYDQWVKRTLKIRHYGHYVDDLYHMHQDKEFLLYMLPRMESFLTEEVHVKVNHDKFRLLPATAANQYLGAYIRPYYTVPRQRTINKFCCVMQEIERQLFMPEVTAEDLLIIRSRINSYLGLLSHYSSFNLRREYVSRPAFYKYFIFDKHFQRAIIRPEYGGKLPSSLLYIPFRDDDMLSYLDDPYAPFPPTASL